MKILLLGSGGREHALAQKIHESPLCEKLFIAPGNPGTLEFGENISIAVNNIDAIQDFAVQHKIDCVVVGPEEPLVLGIADTFKNSKSSENIIVIGPTKNGAMLEGSKSFAKEFMQKHQIPTAKYHRFSDEEFDKSLEYISAHKFPVVLKADGLAAGKGVLICSNEYQAKQGLEDILKDKKFGKAGSSVVIEEFLTGIECSVFVLTDGKNYLILPEAKDYKKIGEGETGLNTGGMGAVSPVPFFDAELRKKIEEKIVIPTIKGLQKDQIDYRGFIFIGLMISNGEPFVIEYNCRMGDPETEVVIPRIKSDLVDLFQHIGDQSLDQCKIETYPKTAVGIVAVSGGYPEEYEKNKIITGLENISDETKIFHAGTKIQDEKLQTNGGRVLVATSFGDNVEDAAKKSLDALQKINFEGKYYRSDIGFEFILKD